MAFNDKEIAQIIELITQHNAHLQYIGARYVPIFGRVGEDSIEWDNSKPYEPLTIVLYQGNSFTSRQFVPEGIDILNQDFWANTGNYNAQIEQYRQEVLQYDGRITANTEAIQNEATARANADEQLEIEIQATRQTYIKKYDTVSDMKNDSSLKIGMTAKTNGFYSVNDNGGALYTIVENETANEMDIISLSNGYFAKLIVESETINPAKLGAKFSSDSDDSPYIQRAVTLGNVKFPYRKSIYIGNTVSIPSRRTIDFNNCTLHWIGAQGYMFSAIANDRTSTSASIVSVNMFDADVTINEGAFLKCTNVYFWNLNKIRIRGANERQVLPIVEVENCFNFICDSLHIYGAANSTCGIKFIYGSGGTSGTANLTNVNIINCLVQNIKAGSAYYITRPSSGAADSFNVINCGVSSSLIGYNIDGAVRGSYIQGSRCEFSDTAIKNNAYISVRDFQITNGGTTPIYLFDNEGRINVEGSLSAVATSSENTISLIKNNSGIVDFSNCKAYLAFATMIASDRQTFNTGQINPISEDAINYTTVTGTSITSFTTAFNRLYITTFVYFNVTANFQPYNGMTFSVFNNSEQDVINVAMNGSNIGTVAKERISKFMYVINKWVQVN